MPEKIYQPGEYYNYPLIIKKILSTPLGYSPDREIVYSDQSRYSYKIFYERINRLAGGLAQLDVKPGDVVAVFDYDSHRYFECFFAVPMMGAVLQTVNWRLSPDQIHYTLQHAQARFIIIHNDFFPILEDIIHKLEGIESIVMISENSPRNDTKLSIDADYEDMLEVSPLSYDFPDLDEDTKATTFYTTGTTGNPKGVHYTHRQLMLHTLAVAVTTGSYDTTGRFRSNDVYMPLTPLFHVHAWGFPYVATLLGTKQVYPGQYQPERIIALIETEKVTFSHCVPTILQMVINSPAARQADLSRWKVTIGGARLPRGLAQTAMEMGIEIHAGYGMSETCPIMTTATLNEYMFDWEEDQKLDVLIKTGKPIPLAEVEVADQDDNLLPHDGVSTGEVVMRSPWLTQSYFKAPEKTQELWRNGWLYSGDVGYIDADGYLQITDRIKDVIKSGGEWISSLDLENMMSQHEAVLESAAIGIPDEKWGERPLMIVILKPEYKGRVTEADFITFMQKFVDQGKLPKYGVPEHYTFVDEIPKTSVGKLDKKMLRNMFAV